MSKGLEALREIKHFTEPFSDFKDFSKHYKIIEKELKALEIIKSKPCLVNDVVESKGNYDVYKSWCNTFRADMKYRATKEEYDLLKEVLL